MPAEQNRFIKKLILLSIIALFTIPQINNLHFDPSPTFWGQITFAWVGIMTFLVIIFSQKRIHIPFIVIPITIFAIYILIQQFFVYLPFVGLNYITALEMLICILLAISVNTIISNYNLKTFMVYLSIALLISALLQSAIGFVQYTNLFKYFGGLIFYDPAHPNTNIFGHFGQRNHYCHFLSWATFALIYLTHMKLINKYLFIPLICWLMFSMTIAASRSVFIYFALANIITAIYFLVTKDKDSLKLFLLTIVASILLLSFEYFYPLLQNSIHASQVASGFGRLASSEGSETGRRLVEWKKAFITFKENFVFGAGWYGYARNSVFLYKLFPNTPLNSGLFINCHNLILQLLAETGIIGTLIVLFGIIYAFIRILKNASDETIIICCMIATTLAHSMLEYPLWYLYFLGPLIMFFSIDKPIYIAKQKVIWFISILPILCLSFLLINNSFTFDKIVNYMDTPDDLATFQKQAHELENIANNHVLASYFAIFALDNYINIDSAYTVKTFTQNEQIKYESLFTNFQPYPDNMIKLAKLQWISNKQQDAKELVFTAVTAFPVYKSSILNSLHSKRYRVLYNIANRQINSAN